MTYFEKRAKNVILKTTIVSVSNEKLFGYTVVACGPTNGHMWTWGTENPYKLIPVARSDLRYQRSSGLGKGCVETQEPTVPDIQSRAMTDQPTLASLDGSLPTSQIQYIGH